MFLSQRDLAWAQEPGLGRTRDGAFEEHLVCLLHFGTGGQGQALGVQPVALGRANLLVTGKSPRRGGRCREGNHTRAQEKTVARICLLVGVAGSRLGRAAFVEGNLGPRLGNQQAHTWYISMSFSDS